MTEADISSARRKTDRDGGRSRRRRGGWGLSVGLLLLGGLLLLLHGCHGDDEDHELFAGCITSLRIAIRSPETKQPPADAGGCMAFGLSCGGEPTGSTR